MKREGCCKENTMFLNMCKQKDINGSIFKYRYQIYYILTDTQKLLSIKTASYCDDYLLLCEQDKQKLLATIGYMHIRRYGIKKIIKYLYGNKGPYQTK